MFVSSLLASVVAAASATAPTPYLLPGEVAGRAPLANGALCIGCTIVLSLVEQGNGVESLLDKLCPKNSTATCEAAIHAVVKLLEDGESPDKLCKDVGLCPKNGACALRPNWPHATSTRRAHGAMDSSADIVLRRASSWARRTLFAPFSERGRAALLDQEQLLGGIPCGPLNVTCIVNRVANDHLAAFDKDNDGFDGVEGLGSVDGALDGTLRGFHWRGRDCDINAADVHPGVLSDDRDSDMNCNGISGAPSATAATYEEAWCSGDALATRGLAVLGDSATAHFHVPPKWLNATGWTVPTLNAIVQAVGDELDRPECAWSSGHVPAAVDRGNTACPESHGLALNSLYQRMRARNLCMHRDFQNVGVNGARIDGLDLVASLQRNSTSDKPLTTFLALIGNDVCNGHAGSSHMTTPSEFNTSLLSMLDALDAKLPPKSHVAIVGLVDGRILWDTMHARTHPLGSSYAELYSFLSCHDDNPCWGWLNSNETWRNYTSNRAAQLNAVSAATAATRTYKNFNLHYFAVDFRDVLNKWVAAGNDPAQLIEPADGFHPSQTGHMLQAEAFYNYLEANAPELLGAVNPNNAAIAKQFGNQGGE